MDRYATQTAAFSVKDASGIGDGLVPPEKRATNDMGCCAVFVVCLALMAVVCLLVLGDDSVRVDGDGNACDGLDLSGGYKYLFVANPVQKTCATTKDGRKKDPNCQPGPPPERICVASCPT